MGTVWEYDDEWSAQVQSDLASIRGELAKTPIWEDVEGGIKATEPEHKPTATPILDAPLSFISGEYKPDIEKDTGLLSRLSEYFKQDVSQTAEFFGGATADMLKKSQVGEEPSVVDYALSGAEMLPMAGAGITTWHGSGALFNRLSHKFMDSGEGAQIKGWGTYLAESKDVGKAYQDSVGRKILLSDDGSPKNFLNRMFESADATESSLLKAREDILGRKKRGLANGDKEFVEKMDGALKLLDEGYSPKSTGHLYEVDLPDEAIDKMLDLDKPLSKQSEYIKKVLNKDPLFKAQKDKVESARKAAVDRFEREGYSNLSRTAGAKQRELTRINTFRNNPEYDPNGESIYDMVYSVGLSKHPKAGVSKEYSDPKAASEYLDSIGIKGNKYLDAGSRSANDGTKNFVVFNEDTAKILKRDDIKINE
jgi:hypothetical protein